MCEFDPISFMSSSPTQNINKYDYFGFQFESQFSPEIWSEFVNNYFVTPISESSSHSGQFNSVIIGCCGELLSQTSFILTDLAGNNVKVVVPFSTNELYPGALVILNCPNACQSPSFHLKLASQNQLLLAGKVPGFAICERFGHYHSCSKYVDSTKNKLCHFHRVYYRLKAVAMKRTPLTASELQTSKIFCQRKLSTSSLSVSNTLSNLS